MNGTLTVTLLDRARLARAADCLAVAVVVSLPWSTSATSILVVLWLLALVPTLDAAMLRRELWTPAGGLAALFWLIGAVGMLWAEVPLRERLAGLDSFHKFLVIPLLLAQFRRSGNGRRVVIGFFLSCSVLLVASYIHAVWRTWNPGPYPQIFSPGVPVKDYILQSGEFQLCVFGLAYAAVEAWRSRRPRLALALGLLACAFLADIIYVATGRTAVAAMPVLLALFGFRQFGWKGMLGVVVAGAALAAVAWQSSPYLRARVTAVAEEIHLYRTQNAETSSGERLELWQKSLGFIAAAPVLGHGTGSIEQQFRGVVGASGPAAIISNNPHQQTLTVAIQLGLVGVAVMFAMWAAHLALFRGGGLVAWAGLVVVVQNVVSSLFNSHLFDFTQGWIYVFGVGALGGAVLSMRPPEPAATE
jgi:O-antigen ligase